jgi:hypothetical protein
MPQVVHQELTSKEIASPMRFSPNTAKAFVRLIMMKASTRSAIAGKPLGTVHSNECFWEFTLRNELILLDYSLR